MKIYLELFISFVRVGVMTFGGGYAMLPILQREIVEGRGWADDAELSDYFAIGQCTPGVIAVNTATFIGNKLRGISGAIVATLSLALPSLVIITVIAALLSGFSEYPAVINAFAGIRVCVSVLILNSVLKLKKSSVIDVATLVIFIVVLVGSVLLDISPVVFVLLAGVAGVIVKSLEVKRS